MNSIYILRLGSEGMAGSLCYEAGSKLQQLERFGESLWFLERACQKWPESTVLKVECFLLLAKSQVSGLYRPNFMYNCGIPLKKTVD